MNGATSPSLWRGNVSSANTLHVRWQFAKLETRSGSILSSSVLPVCCMHTTGCRDGPVKGSRA
jgi:hypothetical protein